MTAQPERRIRRRTLLAAVGLTLIPGCSGKAPRDTAAPAPAGTTPSAATTLPSVEPYDVRPGEVEPGCKAAAATALTAALTWQPGQQAHAVQDRLVAAGAAPSLAGDLGVLIGGHLASTVEISYPQYGGLGASRRTASIMVVARQQWRTAPGAPIESRELTLDVRLSKVGDRWVAQRALVPDLPSPAATPDRVAQQILHNDAVVLPQAAQADLLSGGIDPRLMDLLQALSRKWRIHVQVLKSGHPATVYGTRRLSNHTKGRAADIWSIDDVPIIAHQRSLCAALMREAAKAGADEIGGPVDVDRRAHHGPYFANDLHKDHVHVGFETP